MQSKQQEGAHQFGQISNICEYNTIILHYAVQKCLNIACYFFNVQSFALLCMN